MAVYNYAEKFESMIQEKYVEESKTNFLVGTNPQVKFIGAQTIKVPNRVLGGYGAHDRSKLGFNSSNISNSWTPYKLEWDRDLEYFMDPEDIDETNLVLSFANIQKQVEEDVAIPEKDKYRISKLYKEAKAKGAKIDTTVLTAANILQIFDKMMEDMDDKSVKAERVLMVTPAVNTLLKNAEGIQRTLEASGAKNVNRIVHSLDDVEIKVIGSDRMKTAYEDVVDEDGIKSYVATADAGQINMILVEKSSIICEDKYSYIHVFTPGSDSRSADAYVYQNRYFMDLFLIEAKKAGLAMNVTGVVEG